MSSILNICICFLLVFKGVPGLVSRVPGLSWLPCEFLDEKVELKTENNQTFPHTEYLTRAAMLQFSPKEEVPVDPKVVTFMVSGSKLDLRRYLQGAEPEKLDCELRRFSTKGLQVRWPGKGSTDYNLWYSWTIKHTENLFTLSGFLREPSDQPAPGRQDYHNWTVIRDSQVLKTTVALLMKTETPSVKSGLRSQPKLHCQFSVDHRGPDLTLEWFLQRRGEKTTLFRYNSHSGQTQGSGVQWRGLSEGDASFSAPYTQTSSEGTYVCSVAVNPLFSRMDINLHIQEPPKVSLSVGPVLTLQRGEELKVVCSAEGYFPLDVDIIWYEQDPAASGLRVGAPLPKVLDNILLSSHKHRADQTLSKSGFFYLQTSSREAGTREFTCSVSHTSLRVPVKKSFILTVEEPSSWMFHLLIFVVMATLLLSLGRMLQFLHSARKKSVEKKPY